MEKLISDLQGQQAVDRFVATKEPRGGQLLEVQLWDANGHKWSDLNTQPKPEFDTTTNEISADRIYIYIYIYF